MPFKRGIHFYINVNNYVKIIENEENRTGKLTHSLHALNTFFTLVERFALSSGAHIEKITSSRIHLYFDGEIDDSTKALLRIAIYSLQLSSVINKAGKYNILKEFNINMGASFGDYYYHTFSHNSLDEDTSFGYPCNFAAKLQSKARDHEICVDKEVCDSLRKLGIHFSQDYSVDFDKKYKNGFFYRSDLFGFCSFSNRVNISIENLMGVANEYINKTNLSEIEFAEPKEKLFLDNTYLKYVYKIDGIPLFADIRGFSKKFDPSGSNLSSMAKIAELSLKTMYDIVLKQKGTHIQFQGDREFAIFHDYGDYSCTVNAVFAGLRIIDELPKISYGNGDDKAARIEIGVGESVGSMFATRLGCRGNKDNIVIGKVVNDADIYEDTLAQENELVISKDIYSELVSANKALSSIFSKKNADTYSTIHGYSYFRSVSDQKQLERDNLSRNYNGAWSPIKK